MEVAAAFLADAASSRGGLLYVISGGVNRLRKRGFPSPLGVAVVVMVELRPEELGSENRHRVELVLSRDDVTVMTAGIEFAVATSPTSDQLPIQAPMVIDLDEKKDAIAEPGLYSIAIKLEGAERRRLHFLVEQGPAADELPDTLG